MKNTGVKLIFTSLSVCICNVGVFHRTNTSETLRTVVENLFVEVRDLEKRRTRDFREVR